MSGRRTESVFVAGPCDLRCGFCDRQGRGSAIDVALEELGGARELTIAGCDPAGLEGFAELVERARIAGAFRVAVESNGATLHDFAALGVDEVVLTLPPTNDADRLLGRPGARARWCELVASLREQAVEVRVRLPLLALTLGSPRARVADLMERLRGGRARLVGVEPYVPRDPGKLRDRAPGLAELRAALGELVSDAEHVRLLPRSGLPFCALPAAQRTRARLPFDGAQPARRDADDALGASCERCVMREACTGVRRWQLERDGDGELEPLDAAPGEVAEAPAPRARRSGRFRVVLSNQCEATFGYGPGASEYLRAELLAQPDLADAIEVEILFPTGKSPRQVADAIEAAEPDLLGMTAYSWNLAPSGETARELRRRGAGFPIVWGGVSFARFDVDHDWFEWWDAVDAVARGSGEHTLVDLVRALLAGQRIEQPLPGLVVSRGGKLVWGPPTRLPRALDDFASPYLRGVVHEVERPTIEMARGCIFQCSFCSDAKASREGRMLLHSVERLASEIAAVTRWPKAKWIDAGASTANVNDRVLSDVCEAIRRGDPSGKLRYGFQLYPALASPEQARALEGVPVGALHFGVQSLSPDTFRPMRRGTRLDHVERALSLFRDAGPLELSLILGLPGETFDSFRQTFEALLRFPEARLVVNRLLVLPGTELHLRRRELGVEHDPARYHRVRSVPGFPAEDLRRAQEWVIERSLALPDLVIDGEPRVRWVNFDIQGSFAAPPEYGFG